MKTVIVTPELNPGAYHSDIGRFVHQFTRLLRTHMAPTDTLLLIYTGEMTPDAQQWADAYRQQGIDVVYEPDQGDSNQRIGYEWFYRRAEKAANLLPDDADVVYFQDRGANGFLAARRKRYQHGKTPTLVTVLHGGTDWLRDANQQMPLSGYTDLTIAYAEQYAAEHSDFVVSPTQHMLDWVAHHGWTLGESTHVAGYPLLPDESSSRTQATPSARKRLVYLGALETRLGIEVFVECLLQLHGANPAQLTQLEEVVLLGEPGDNRYGDLSDIAAALRPLDTPVHIMADTSYEDALAYLRQNAAGTLVVMPATSGNMPYTALDVLCVPELACIISENSGTDEVLGGDANALTTSPHVKPLRRKLEAWLLGETLPTPDYDVAHYNEKWLQFHAMAAQHAASSNRPAPAPIPDGEILVNVCVPYYNLPKFLPQTLHSLAIQTCPNFNVIVVNDGSTNDEANRVFGAMREQYAPRGWQFHEKENGGVGQTRNIAVAQGDAPYILFVDADNVAAPNMVERFLGAMLATDDDCLTCYMYAFAGEDPPYDDQNGEMVNLSPPVYIHTPLGNSGAAGMLENPFGDANMIMKRSVFEAVGGFREDHYVSFEDRELLTLVSLAGYKIDVVPEYLFFYRHREGGFSKVTSQYRNEMRIQRVYREKLKEVGLEPLAPMVYGLTSFRYQPEWVANYMPMSMLRRALLIKVANRLLAMPALPTPLKRWTRRWKSRLITQSSTKTDPLSILN